MSIILEVKKVSKSYSAHRALHQVSFNVPANSIFGLLGPNGAGKTSLIRIITNITQADEGEVLLNGQNTTNIPRGTIGYMPEERGLYKKMKVEEQLEYFCLLRRMSPRLAAERVHYWLRKMNIADWAHKNVEELSKGMQQKIQFIATVMHEPPLLILDEPFSGLDPVNTELIMAEILELKQKGTTIIFSTHRMEQVEEICDRIVLINKGENVLEDAVDTLKQKWKENIFNVAFETHPDTTALPTGIQLQKDANDLMVLKSEDRHTVNRFIREQITAGNELVHMEEVLPSLNDIFIKKVNEKV